jgi:hypothetical protein
LFDLLIVVNWFDPVPQRTSSEHNLHFWSLTVAQREFAERFARRF